MRAPAQAVAASLDPRSAESWAMPALTRQQKITFGEMRASGVRGVLIYCADYRCSHSTPIIADRWPDEIRLSDMSLGSRAGVADIEAPTSGRIGIRSMPLREKGWSTSRTTRLFRGLCPAPPIKTLPHRSDDPKSKKPNTNPDKVRNHFKSLCLISDDA
jgi:hypothetical protein